MDNRERRVMALRQIKNTLIECAKKDDTIHKGKLVTEIMWTYGVSERTAKMYINELVNMGIANEDSDYIWHGEEKEIKNQYLKEEK